MLFQNEIISGIRRSIWHVEMSLIWSYWVNKKSFNVYRFICTPAILFWQLPLIESIPNKVYDWILTFQLLNLVKVSIKDIKM